MEKNIKVQAYLLLRDLHKVVDGNGAILGALGVIDNYLSFDDNIIDKGHELWIN